MLILIVNHKEDEFTRHTLMISLFPGCIRGWSGLRATSSLDDDLTRDMGEGDRRIVNSDINIRDIGSTPSYIQMCNVMTMQCTDIVLCAVRNRLSLSKNTVLNLLGSVITPSS